MMIDSIPSQWMVVLDYSSKLHGLQPRVGRFVRQSPCTEDMEFFGGPENYYSSVSEARDAVAVLNAPD